MLARPTYNRKKVFCKGTKYVDLLVTGGLTSDMATFKKTVFLDINIKKIDHFSTNSICTRKM